MIPLIISTLFLFIISQAAIHQSLSKSISKNLDDNLRQSTMLTHDLIENSIRESLRNYLRGRVEDSLYSIQSIYAASERGAISEETAKSNARVGLLNRVIGTSGYFYVINSTGEVQIHPNKEMEGTNQLGNDFVRRQTEVKIGYLEYEWQNPREEAPREKALYMIYFEPWDWIITATAYRSEFRNIISIDHIRSKIAEARYYHDGYSFIVNEEGLLLAHPYFEGTNVRALGQGEELLKVLDSINEPDKNAGMIEYSWKDPSDARQREKRVFYSLVDETGWIVATTFSLDEVYSPLQKTILLISISNLGTLILLIMLLIVLSKKITSPLAKLTGRLLQESHARTSSREDFSTKDEAQIAEQVFNLYISQLKDEKKKVLEANEENKKLAVFPNDIQLPVLRIDESGRCTFINDYAKNNLPPIFDNATKKLEAVLLEKILEEKPAGSSVEKTIAGRIYKIFITPLADTAEVYLHFYDLTVEQKFETLQSVWQSVFENSIEGITITDENAAIERVNKSFTRITGYSREEVIGRKTSLLKSDRHTESFYREMWENLREKGYWAGEIWNRRKSGEAFPEWLSISSFRDNTTAKQKYMAIFHDISDLQKKEEELQYLNSHDILTKLPNRNLFYDRLRQAVSSVQRTGEFCAVVVVDIYGFSKVNDFLGKNTGDEYLIIVADRLNAAIRNEDTLARLGSDDFAIILPRLHRKEQSLDVILRLQELASAAVELSGKQLKPMLNIGISFSPGDGDTADILLQKANTAMLRSKRAKPGSYSFYDDSIDNQLMERFDLEVALRQAIDREEFELMYQPKADLQTGILTGFEALLRWNRPGFGQVSPGAFIPMLEETGMIVEAGHWIMREVCRFIRELNTRRGPTIRVGINISTIQFASTTFLTDLEQIIADETVSPEHIDLEITENVAAENIEKTIAILERLRTRGFTISIDDFGTGYSSLKYLKVLPFDVIKVDRSFISPLPGDNASLSIVRSIVSMAGNLGKQTVAEGIETEEQNEICRTEGCNIIQGYYLSRPLSRKDALEYKVKISQH